MKRSLRYLDGEYRVSALPVIAFVGAAGEFLLLTAVDLPSVLPVPESRYMGALSLGLATISWVVHNRSPRVGRWATMGTLTVLVFLAERWLQLPGILSLLAIPTVLAATMIGLPAAAALTMVQSIFLILTPRIVAPGTTWSTVALALVVVWAMLGLMAGVSRPLRQHAEWLDICTGLAQESLKETRDLKLELKEMRADWLNASRQIQLANERLSSLRIIAERARQSKADFVAKVSHEFRTPLNIITGLINVLVESPEVCDGPLPPKAIRYLEIVYRNSQHLTSMIDDVLDLSQVEAGRMALQLEWTDLSELITATSETIRPIIEEKGLTFSVSVPQGISRVCCDDVRVHQVMLNLLSNAVRLTDRGGIEVNAAQHDGRVVLSVSDTGPGIAPDAAQRIFEPFSKMSTHLWHDKAGSGLGLSICMQFVQLHGGRMWLESELGIGTTFFVELPITGSSQLITRPDRQIMESWIWREGSFHSERAGLADRAVSPRVIVCDQTSDLYSALVRYSSEPEYINASTLPQALSNLRGFPAQTLLINAATPENLWSLMDTARQESPDTPILGCCCPPSTKRAIEAGALGYLTKPVNSKDLAEIVKRIQSAVRSVLVVDDEADSRELTALLLNTNDERLEVLTAENGNQALSLMCDKKPDLVLLDILMPGLSGWDVLVAIQSNKRLSDIPVVMVSGQDPREGPISSKLLITTMGDGISLTKLIDCLQDVSRRLLQPDY